MGLQAKTRWLGVVVGCSMAALLGSWTAPAAAKGPTPVAVAKARPSGGWASRANTALADVQAGKPLVIEVFVPLCSDDKGGPCGKHEGAGDPNNLQDNLYWGAVWGARRFLERKWLGWTRTEAGAGESWELERATYKRSVSGARFGVDGPVDVYLVLHAVQGDAGSDALERFRNTASQGGSVRFNDGTGLRDEHVHVVGFMGRNPLLKNGRVPRSLELPEAGSNGAGIPSFSIAAHSRETLAPWLHASGSRALVLARGAVASEAYLLEAIARGLAENDGSWGLTQRASKTYAQYHKLPENVAEIYFSPNVPKRMLEKLNAAPSAAAAIPES